jgi:hypothetical protein
MVDCGMSPVFSYLFSGNFNDFKFVELQKEVTPLRRGKSISFKSNVGHNMSSRASVVKCKNHRGQKS